MKEGAKKTVKSEKPKKLKTVKSEKPKKLKTVKSEKSKKLSVENIVILITGFIIFYFLFLSFLSSSKDELTSTIKSILSSGDIL